MKIVDIIIIALLAVWVIASIFYVVKSRKSGRCGCSYACSGNCKHCSSHCSKNNKKDRN